MLTVLVCIASVLGVAWLLVLYLSFRKVCAIVLGVAIAISVLFYGIAQIVAIDQRHARGPCKRGEIAILHGKQISKSSKQISNTMLTI